MMCIRILEMLAILMIGRIGDIKNYVKKTVKDREHLPRTLGVLGKSWLALLFLLFLLGDSCFEAYLFCHNIPSGEILKRVDIKLFKITLITNRSEYVMLNKLAITFAVILCVGFLALLILAGIYMNPREKEPVNSSETTAEDDPA